MAKHNVTDQGNAPTSVKSELKTGAIRGIGAAGGTLAAAAVITGGLAVISYGLSIVHPGFAAKGNALAAKAQKLAKMSGVL